MKHKLTKIGNLPYFGQFGAPPSLFCTRPLYPQEVLKVLRVPNLYSLTVKNAPPRPPQNLTKLIDTGLFEEGTISFVSVGPYRPGAG